MKKFAIMFSRFLSRFSRCISFSLSTCVALALLVQGAWADGGAISNAPPASAAAEDGTNTAATQWRDPFWPVGYRPAPDLVRAAAAAVTVSPVQSRWQEARKRLKIQGLTHDRSRYMAVINGRMVETGDRVGVEMDGVRYRWRVQEITAQGVTLENVDALVAPTGGVGK